MAQGKEVEVSSFLEQWVTQDCKHITARLLSTIKKCHISVAHEHMSRFYEEMNKRGSDSVPFTAWIIKGILKPEAAATLNSQDSAESMEVDEEDNSKATLITESLLLIADEKLKEAESRFESINVKQVYSFSPRLSANHTSAHKHAAISQLTTIQHELHSKKEYVDAWENMGQGAKLGTIQSADKWEDSGKPYVQESHAGPSKPAVNSKAAPTVKKEPVEEAKKKKEESKVVGKAAPKAEGLNWGKAKSSAKSKRKLVESDEEDNSRKEVSAEEDDEEDDGPIGYATEASKEAGDVAMERGEASRKRADAGDKISTDEEKRRRRKQELMDMMDEDGDGNADPPTIKASQTASTSMMKGTDDAKEDEDGSKVEEDKAAPVDVSGPKRRIKKHRKVTKKVKTKDSKGYTKTQDVEEYESYSSEESDTPSSAVPAPAPVKVKAASKVEPSKQKEVAAPAMANTNSDGKTAASANGKKNAASSGGAGGQRKLSSFFGKG